MEPLESEARAAYLLQHGRHRLGIDAELPGTPAHLHARALELEVGVDPHRDACRQSQRIRDSLEHGYFTR